MPWDIPSDIPWYIPSDIPRDIPCGYPNPIGYPMGYRMGSDGIELLNQMILKPLNQKGAQSLNHMILTTRFFTIFPLLLGNFDLNVIV